MSADRFPLKFAYNTINWTTNCDLAAAAQEILAAGWQATEMFDHSLDWMGTPDQLRKTLGGLKTATFFGGIEVPSSKDSLHVHKQRIAYAAELGATDYGLVGGGRLRYRTPTDDEYTNLANACEELAEYAADFGIQIGYHPHTGCTIETEAEIDILLDRTRKTMLCLDVSHIALVDEDPVTQLKKYHSRTSYVHMKDWARGKFVELGLGSIGIDFPAIFEWLTQERFPGWIVIENSISDVSPAHSARLNADYIRSLGYSLEIPAEVAQR
jgi:sugar phosphate isomerase/epimerase